MKSLSSRVLSHAVEPVAVTQGGHHFFGYYEKSPWDISGRWMLALETAFRDRPPVAGDVAVVGLIDTEQNFTWRPLAETRAWNWQQGAMLQWVGDGSAGDIIFNDREGDAFVSRVLNVRTGLVRTLGRPVYAMNRSGTTAVSLNFSRLHHQRPGYGYAGIEDPWKADKVPAEDGLYAVDIATGESQMILSVAAAAAYQPLMGFAGKTHRFNHAQFGADDKRFAVLHRYKAPDDEVGLTRLLTLNTDGSELRCLNDHGMVSHYDWLGGKGILAWSERRGIGHRYFYFEDRADAGEPAVIGEDVFSCDGHCSFSPDGRWVLTDTYPDAEHMRTLMLYNWASGERIDIGRFLSPPVNWEIRCDLHPRWSRDGRKVCIDSVHEGTRQVYVLDVSAITMSC